MQFEFEPNLKHQSDAISAVVGIFEGASYIRTEERMLTGNDKSTLLCLDDTLHEKTVDSLIDKYSTHLDCFKTRCRYSEKMAFAQCLYR